MERQELQTRYGTDNLTEKPLAYYLEEYSHSDPHKISSRLGIPYNLENETFTFAFLERTYTASWPELHVCAMDEEDNLFERNPKARILLLRYLLYSAVFFPDGEFRSYRELPSGELYYRVFYGRCIRRLIATYADRLSVFRKAAANVGAVIISGGDAACEIELFDSLYLRMILWQGEDMDPASGQILFSSNFPAAFSAYDLTEIVEIVLSEMKRQEAKE